MDKTIQDTSVIDEPKTRSDISSVSVHSDIKTTEHIDSEPVLTPPTHLGPPSEPPYPPHAPVIHTVPPHKSKILPVLIGSIVLLGLCVLYLLNANKSDHSSMAIVKSDKEGVVTLPTNVIKIQSCADHKGTLYVAPENIPVGPVYMVKAGNVIGIEYMLGKDEFLNGKSFKYLPGFGLKVNHVNIGLLSKGHEGYTAPHYHVDIYTVDKSVESAITCPNSAPTVAPSVSIATPSAQSQDNNPASNSGIVK